MPTFSMDQRRNFAVKKQAMPDGSYPIRNISDLKNAIQSYGRAKNKPAVKRWIIKRARELNATDLIPESWKQTISHADEPIPVRYDVHSRDLYFTGRSYVSTTPFDSSVSLMDKNTITKGKTFSENIDI